MAKSLMEQNVWLRDATKRAAAVRISVASSSAVEGIRKPFAQSSKTIKPVRVKSVKSA